MTAAHIVLILTGLNLVGTLILTIGAGPGGLLVGLLSTAASLVYFLPTIIAYKLENPNKFPIFLLNFLLGWTLIGWVIAIIWANTKPTIAMLHNPANSDARTCPFCAEPIKLAAIKCRHCGSELAQTSATNR